MSDDAADDAARKRALAVVTPEGELQAPHLPRPMPIPGRDFVRGRRCANCSHYTSGSDATPEKDGKAERHFLAHAALDVGPTGRATMIALCVLERAREQRAVVEAHDKKLVIVPNAYDIILDRARAQKVLDNYARDIAQAEELVRLNPPRKGLTRIALEIWASIRRKAADRTPLEMALYENFGIRGYRDDEAGLCAKGCPDPNRKARSDFTCEGGFCPLWTGHVVFDDGLKDELPQEIGELMDAAAKLEPA